MKQSSVLTILVLSASLLYTHALLADENGLYFGIGLGRPDMAVNDLTAQNLPVPDVFRTTPQPASTSNNKPSATTWLAYGGYEINRYLAIEGLYAPLGEYSRNFISRPVQVDVTKPHPDLTIIGTGTFETADKLNIDGFGLMAITKAPFTIHWGLYGKFGVFRWRAQLTSSTVFYPNIMADPPVLAREEKDNGYSPILGIGAYYKLLQRVSLRLEWMRINSVGGSLSTGNSEVNTFFFGTQLNY